MKYISMEGKITGDELIFTVKIPKFYLDEELEGELLLFKTLFKFVDEKVMFCAPMITKDDMIYPPN